MKFSTSAQRVYLPLLTAAMIEVFEKRMSKLNASAAIIKSQCLSHQIIETKYCAYLVILTHWQG